LPNFDSKKQCQNEQYSDELDPLKSYISQGKIEPPSTNGSNSSTEWDLFDAPQTDKQVKRASVYELRTTQRTIVRDIHESLSGCGLGRIEYNKFKRESDGDIFAELKYNERTKEADVANVTHCKSPWASEARN